MPRDVSTRWNSTYDMLEFALAYRAALDNITSDCEMKLRQYEMDGEEWEIAHQLSLVLRVSYTCSILYLCSLSLNPYLIDLQRHYLVFLVRWYPKPCHSHSCYGLY